jgi:methyl coenzyme M reductase subunit D
MESILAAGVLQKSNRKMRVSVGDILTYMAYAGNTYKELRELCENVYTPVNYDQLILERLIKTYTEATVYSWLF